MTNDPSLDPTFEVSPRDTLRHGHRRAQDDPAIGIELQAILASGAHVSAKLLLDENLSPAAAVALAADGIDACHVRSTDWGSWAANDEQKLTMGLRATPAARLAWLEEMIAMACRSGALPRKR